MSVAIGDSPDCLFQQYLKDQYSLLYFSDTTSKKTQDNITGRGRKLKSTYRRPVYWLKIHILVSHTSLFAKHQFHSPTSKRSWSDVTSSTLPCPVVTSSATLDTLSSSSIGRRNGGILQQCPALPRATRSGTNVTWRKSDDVDWSTVSVAELEPNLSEQDEFMR